MNRLTQGMMSATKHFSVGVFGFPELERQVLQRIFSLSATRPHAYRLLVEPDGQPVDIILVDRMNPAAVSKARATADNGIPVVGVIHGKEPQERYSVHRPFTATRTLGVLDRVVENEILNHTSTGASGQNSRSPVETRAAASEAKAGPQFSAPSPSRRKRRGAWRDLGLTRRVRASSKKPS